MGRRSTGGEWEHFTITAHQSWVSQMVVPKAGLPMVAWVDGDDVALRIATWGEEEIISENLPVDILGSGDQVSMAALEDRVYLAHGNGKAEDATTVFRLSDGSWSPMTPSMPSGTSLLSRASLALDADYTLWIATRDQTHAHVLSLSPGAEGWTSAPPIPLPGGPGEIAYSHLFVTSQGEIVLAGRDQGFHLIMAIARPPIDAWEQLVFDETKVFGVPHIVEAWDQSLGILFDDWQGDRLMLLERSPDTVGWILHVLTSEQPAYGASAQVGMGGHMAVSFIDRSDDSCQLLFAMEP